MPEHVHTAGGFGTAHTYGTGPKTNDPALQAQYGMQYIKGRYGSPSAAWAQYYNHPGGEGSYQHGGLVGGRGRGDIVPAMLEPGELVIPRDVVKTFGGNGFTPPLSPPSPGRDGFNGPGAQGPPMAPVAPGHTDVPVVTDRASRSVQVHAGRSAAGRTQCRSPGGPAAAAASAIPFGGGIGAQIAIDEINRATTT